MSFRVRVFGCGICVVALVSAIAVVQNRAADANNPQPAPAQTAADLTAYQTAAKPDASETVYFDLAAPLKAARETEDAIRKSLEKPITVKFNDTPLKDAVAYIGKQCGVQTFLDVVSLKEAGIIGLDEAVTFSCEQSLPATTVLSEILYPIELAGVIENEALTIIDNPNNEDLEHGLRLYNVSPLVRSGFSVESVADVIQNETSGPWMNVDGTGGTIKGIENVLVVYASQKNNVEIKIILKTLERVGTGSEKNGTVPLLWSSHDRKIYAALASKVSAEFRETSLKDVVAFLTKRVGVNIVLNETALAEEGITPDEPITMEFKDITLKSALGRILRRINLTYVIEGGTVSITTDIDADETFDTFVFNVRDFSNAGYPMDMLIKSIQSATSGPWLDVDGTGGTIDDTLPDFLIIRQTWKNLEEAAFHVDELRSALKKSSPDGKLPKVTRDPDGLTLKQYHITSLPIEDVRDAISKFVEPNSWKSAGGKGKGDLAIIESKIVIRQSRDVHKKIDKFLQEIGEGFGGGLDLGMGGLGSGGSFFSID